MPAEAALDILRRAERVALIGCGGSGKSTLAAQLAPRLGLPLTQLDTLFWKPGWVPTPTGEWDAMVASLVAQPSWLIDGNYGRTMPLRLARADLVIWLDLPTATCLWRAFRRAFASRGKVRPDMAEGCPEHFDLGFLRWIAGYRQRQRPDVLQWRKDAPSTQAWITLTSAAQVRRLWTTLSATECRVRSSGR